MTRIATLKSSSLGPLPSDALKDEDNAAWVMTFDEPVRTDWLTTLEWMRTADRLVESDEIAFCTFMSDWHAMRTGMLPTKSPFSELFKRLAARWKREGLTERDLECWDLYLEALWHYRDPGRVILTMEDYRASLYRMSAGIFQALPFKPAALHAAAGWLGALDQFFNNLRDLREDVDRGLCYFPKELLSAFGIEAAELPQLVRRSDARFARMHEHLLSEVVPELLRNASPLLSASGLHASWAEMVHQLRLRHARIEYVARRCRFDATRFAREYWVTASAA